VATRSPHPGPTAPRSSRRISAAALLFACVALAGCGFHPLYAESEESGEFDADLASVSVTPIAERIGQIVANALRDSFNPARAKVPQRYVLTVVLTTSTGDYAIRKDGTASRELLAVSGSFNMYALGGERPVLTGSVTINDSYDVGENEYSVIVANNDAQARAAQEISTDIRTRVALYFRRAAKT
jgi:LPS-assembly lipoprotein